MIFSRCCNCGGPSCPGCVCEHYTNSCAPCCYLVTFSGFTGAADVLNTTLHVKWYQDCGWRVQFCNPSTGASQYLTIAVTISDSDYIVTVTFGSVATFTKNLGSTKPALADDFDTFTRTSGAEGSCDLVESHNDDTVCSYGISGCSVCRCLLAPAEWKLVVSGIVNGDGCQAGSKCADMNGTWILSKTSPYLADCEWAGPHMDGPLCCATQGSAWFLQLNYAVWIASSYCGEGTHMGFTFPSGLDPLDCRFIKDLSLVPWSNQCDFSGATCLLSAVQ